MSRPKLQGASFDPDAAEVLPKPPSLFKTLHIHCPVCGIRLINQHYAFFPSTLYIEGHCCRCNQTRAAFFAPEPDTIKDPEPMLPPDGDVDHIVRDFLSFLVGEASPDAAEHWSPSDTDDTTKPEKSGMSLDGGEPEPFNNVATS